VGIRFPSVIVLFRKHYLPISLVSLHPSYNRDHPCSGSTVLLTCPLYNSKPQYFLSLCRYVGQRKHKVFLFIALKPLLEPALYLHQSFAIFCAASLSQLQGSNGTELISLYVVLHSGIPQAEYFWKIRCWRLRRREHISCYCWLVKLQGLLQTDIVWNCWHVWRPGGEYNGCDGLTGSNVRGRDGGCNGCNCLLGLTLWGQGDECNCWDGLLEFTALGKAVDVKVGMVFRSYFCECRTVDIMLVMVCWS